jgi:hypothetical protein
MLMEYNRFKCKINNAFHQKHIFYAVWLLLFVLLQRPNFTSMNLQKLTNMKMLQLDLNLN